MIALPELRVVFAPSLLATPFLVLLALAAPAAVLYVLRRERISQLPLLLAFIGSMTAVLLAQSLAAFAFSWEVMALVSAVLVATYHERRAVRRAVLSYLFVGQFGFACIVSALAILAMHAHSTLFADIARSAQTLPVDIRTAAVMLALAGFGSKAGLLPLHFWLPRAHPVAPAAASALLSGVMLKIAVYGLLLVCFTLAAPIGVAPALVITAAGLITAVAGAVYAAIETDLKRLLAFSSIENIGVITGTLGFALVALACGSAVLAAIAVAAMLFHVFAHGLFKSALFLGAGEIQSAAHTTDLEHLGGLMRALRFSAPALLVACLAAASLPPLSGFASEWLIFQALIHSFEHAARTLQLTAAFAILAIAFAGGVAAIAFIKAFGVGILGIARSTHPRSTERFGAPSIALAWLALCTLVLGAVPALALHPALRLAASIVPGSAGAGVAITLPPVWIAALPVLGALAVLLLAKARGIRRVPTWTCGSPVTVRSQYSATAFSNPLRVLLGEFARAHVDRVARTLAAFVQRLARRTRVVQAGYVRVYLAYALAALIAVLVIAR